MFLNHQIKHLQILTNNQKNKKITQMFNLCQLRLLSIPLHHLQYQELILDYKKMKKIIKIKNNQVLLVLL